MGKQRLEYCYQNMSELVLFITSDGEIVDCNDAAMKELLYKKDDIVKRNISLMFPSFFQDVNHSLTIRSINTEARTTAYRSNDTCFVARIKVIPIPDEEYVCIVTNEESYDVMERKLKATQDQLENALNIKNEFIANITHELRTPVNGVQGLVKMLMNSDLNKEESNSLQVINDCCNTMSKLIDDLLDFSKMRAGKLDIEEKEFSFYKWLDVIISIHSAQAKQKGIKFVCSVEKDIPDQLIGDEFRLSQILNNLISNAIKFTQEGQISLEISNTKMMKEEIELFFIVMDTGIGISANEKDKLFKSFSQVDATITRRFGGTGLGLSICKELVRMMNGKIDVTSDKGKGSCFYFTVRLKVPKESVEDVMVTSPTKSYESLQAKYKYSEGHKIELKKVTTKDNLDDILDTMNKLVLCLELNSWVKAESFAGVIKQLIVKEDTHLRKKAFQLELAVRKEDYIKSMELYKELNVLLVKLKD